MNDIRFYSFLGLVQKSGNMVSGYNNCVSEIKADKCELVLIAEDASENTKDRFKSLCISKKIPYIIYGSMEKYGQCIGKSCKSILGIKNENMSKVVKDMFN